MNAVPDGSRGEWRRGWPIVAAAVVGIGTGPGLFQNMSSLFTPGMSAEFGWSRGDIATASGMGFVGALAAPLLGRLADRVGVRPVIAGSMLLIGLAHLGMALLTGSLWHYQLLVFVLALTVSGTSAVVYGKLIAGSFVRHRGIALGLGTSGISVATLAMPGPLGATIAAYGWRGGFVALAVLASVVALPLVLLAIRGAAPGRVAAIDVPLATTGALPDGPSGAEARRQGRFWRLGLTAFLINFGTVGLVTQLVPFGIDRGLSAAQAALLLTAYGASQVVGRLAMGLLIDRFAARRMAAAAAALSAVALVGLQVDQPSFALAMLLVFGAGLMNGAEHDLLPYLTARLFGLRAYGEIYGSILVLALLGTAGGIVGFGRLYDATGGYGLALGIAATGMALAALLFVSLDDREPAAHATGR